jgi:two-component system, chemotaxis family, chemotaxis protein CheY
MGRSLLGLSPEFPGNPNPQLPTPERKPMARVLVVDDAAFMRVRAARVLQDAGHEVVEAENGHEALKLYAECRPDVVLMDITMPEMDGLAALKEIRKLDPEARVAMVTAMGQQAIVMEALKAGAKDFVLKPFQPERVLSSLRKLLAA